MNQLIFYQIVDFMSSMNLFLVGIIAGILVRELWFIKYKGE